MSRQRRRSRRTTATRLVAAGWERGRADGDDLDRWSDEEDDEPHDGAPA